MLKIKDNVDLKELEKFGFKNLENCYYKDVDPDDGDWLLRIDKKTREIKCWNFINGKTKNAEPYIKDLIKANLVEKVGEK